jgi:hypothetical protein
VASQHCHRSEIVCFCCERWLIVFFVFGRSWIVLFVFGRSWIVLFCHGSSPCGCRQPFRIQTSNGPLGLSPSIG